MAIPFTQTMSSKTTTPKQKLEKTQIIASGTFIIPPGGKEVNRNTAGKRVVCCNVGDKITILADNPKALFLLNKTIPAVRIKGRGFSGRVLKIDKNKENYLRFENHGDDIVKIKAQITPC